MPSDARDQRKAQRAENARRWGEWLARAMTQAKMEPKDIINGSKGVIDKGAVSHWLLGDYGASVENVLIVARILRRDPVEALRAAGHEALADSLAQSIDDATTRARIDLVSELRKYGAGLDNELDARFAQYLPSDSAPQPRKQEGDEDAS